MKRIHSPFVIAIASVSGGGKTTAVERLAKHLPNTQALYFDDYDFVGPSDLMQWLHRGANYNEWNLSPLIKALEKLLVQPYDYILLDFPFANQHTASKAYIDFTIFIDTPLDLALARRLGRESVEKSKEEILIDVQYYATTGRAAYLQMLTDVKSNSGLLIDGAGSKEEVAMSLIVAIENIEK